MNSELAKLALLFVVMFIAVYANVPPGTFAPLGVESNVVVALGVAVIVTGLISQPNVFLIGAVIGLCLMANLPESTLADIGLSRTLVLAALMAVVMTPLVAKLVD